MKKYFTISRINSRLFLLILFVFNFSAINAQLRNSTWLLGNQELSNIFKARMVFSLDSFNLQQELRKMRFEGTEATMSDQNGNFIFGSNGVWICNALNDTMQNGDSLNPNSVTLSAARGLQIPYANLALTYPNDTTKYLVFHHTADFNGYSYPSYNLFYTTIDMTLDNGLGGVISKNDTVLSDTLNWGIAACKHANGRDWWVVMQKHDSNIIFKILLTPSGISIITSQQLNVPKAWYNSTQPTFSPDGKKFAYSLYEINADTTDIVSSLIVCDFDRCNGMFSNETTLTMDQSRYLWGVAFSPNSQILYTTTTIKVIQVNLSNMAIDTVAFYDGYISPPNLSCCQSTFFNMYLAANGKIYVTSGNGVQHIHEINFPDSAGLACDVQQHAIDLGVWNFHTVPNHPNYNLGCDTMSGCSCLTAIEDFKNYDFKFSVSPNPVSNGQLKIVYMLPQNKKGVFEVFDVTGKNVFSYNLPQWSTLQNFDLRFLGGGVYHCTITSGGERVSRKLVVLKN